jgi:dynein regulatory complex protein 1
MEKNILISRERKLREKMASFRKLYYDKEKEFNRENVLLTEEFKKATRAFRELQKKYKHFEKDDTLRYQEIFDMNAAESRTLAGKILKCDKTIYVQQLGLPWVQPEDADMLLEEEDKEELEAKEAEPAEKQSGSHKSPSIVVSVQRIRQVFTLLVDECGFLVEDKVKDQCSEKSEKEGLTLKIDSIRKTLGVETMEDVELLVGVFYQGAKDALYQSDSEDEGDPDQLVVEPENVIDLLFQFKEAKESNGGLGVTGASKSHESGGKSPYSGKSVAKDGKEKQQGPSFWERMVGILPESHLRTWKVLVKTFQNYYNLLQARQELVEETGVLHQQNDELRTLLKQYLDANVNQELIVPPTQMIKFDEAEEMQ